MKKLIAMAVAVASIVGATVAVVQSTSGSTEQSSATTPTKKQNTMSVGSGK